MVDTRFLNNHFNKFYERNTGSELEDDIEIFNRIEKTISVLEACEKVNADAVCLCVPDPCVPRSETFTFGASRSLFITGDRPKKEGGWPKAWAVRDMAKLTSSCGNGDQAQIDPEEIVEGAYVRVDGSWYLSQEEPITKV